MDVGIVLNEALFSDGRPLAFISWYIIKPAVLYEHLVNVSRVKP